MSRRKFLEWGRRLLAGVVLLGLSGCAGNNLELPEPPKKVTWPDFEDTSLDAEPVRIEIKSERGTLWGLLYPAEATTGAVVMVGGAGGGIHGPAGVYEPLADRLQAEGITALRLDYREPSDLEACIYDVLAAIDGLSQYGVDRFILVGWSFGGAVVISGGAASDAVVGVATVASQTYGAQAVGELSPKSLLLIHGTADTVLPADLSRQLYSRAGEPKELVLYPGDGHGIERHTDEMLEKLQGWSRNLLLSR